MRQQAECPEFYNGITSS